MRLTHIWKRISAIDAKADLVISTTKNNIEEMENDLVATLGSGEIMVDSASVSPRPMRFLKARDALLHHTEVLEFIAYKEAGNAWWAVTEEEHEWLIFHGQKNEVARQDDVLDVLPSSDDR